MAEVKLLGLLPSPYVYRVIWALKLKGIPYEFVKEDLPNKSPLLLKYNPVHKKIPVLVHGEKSVCESMIIVEYINEVWPQNPLLPNDPHQRAVARFWAKFADDKGPSVFRIFRTGEDEMEKVKKEVLEMLQATEDHGLGDKKFLGGDQIGIADIAFGSVIHWLTVMEEGILGAKLLEPHKFPRLYSWLKNFQQAPVIKENLPDFKEAVAFYKGRREALLGGAASNIMAEVKLLGQLPSPYVYRVTWALKIKGIQYEFVPEDIANKSPLLLKYNPVHRKIPALVHGGKPICESMIIVQYIDEVWPQNPLLPSDPHERAVARFWVKFADDKGLSVFKIFRSGGEAMEQAIKETMEMLQAIEDHGLGNKKFFGGDQIGIADIAIGSDIHWLAIIEEAVGFKLLDPHRYPRLHGWLKNFQQVPVIKENLPDWDETVAFFRARRQDLLMAAASQ
ncbi:hypothetical protein Tsubulata_025394 [Turnera subulata]|uniref:glutathione transferase n=1 Tax=Turnera subulata TaxID=218843 RepID=A0A9Q0FFF2_9ROSI|nr:hypothetical protein Tsubulata_025394 [Turnera subulata]